MRRVLKLQIIKPVDGDWDRAGRILRKVKRGSECAARLTQSKLLKSDDIFELATVVDSTKDGKVVGSQIELPKNLKLDFSDSDLNGFAREKYPWINSRIISYVVRDVRSRYRGLRFSCAIGKKSVPSYRRYSFTTDSATLKKVGTSYVLRLGLLSRTADEDFSSMSFIVGGKRLRAHHYQEMDKLCEQKKVTAQVSQNQKKQWFVHLHFDQEASTHSELMPERTLYVHPFSEKDESILQCYMEDKPVPRCIEIEFESALQTALTYEKHSKAISRKYRQDRGGGNRGHGRNRAIRVKKQRQAKYGMSSTTFNQQRGAFIAKIAVQWKCGNVCYISPAHAEIKRLSSWPWYQLGQCIANACEREGIKYKELDTKSLEKFKKSFDSIEV